MLRQVLKERRPQLPICSTQLPNRDSWNERLQLEVEAGAALLKVK